MPNFIKRSIPLVLVGIILIFSLFVGAARVNATTYYDFADMPSYVDSDGLTVYPISQRSDLNIRHVSTNTYLLKRAGELGYNTYWTTNKTGEFIIHSVFNTTQVDYLRGGGRIFFTIDGLPSSFTNVWCEVFIYFRYADKPTYGYTNNLVITGTSYDWPFKVSGAYYNLNPSCFDGCVSIGIDTRVHFTSNDPNGFEFPCILDAELGLNLNMGDCPVRTVNIFSPDYNLLYSYSTYDSIFHRAAPIVVKCSDNKLTFTGGASIGSFDLPYGEDHLGFVDMNTGEKKWWQDWTLEFSSNDEYNLMVIENPSLSSSSGLDGFLSSFWNSFVGGITESFASLNKIISPMFNGISNAITSLSSDIYNWFISLGKKISDLGSFVVNNLSPFFEDVSDSIFSLGSDIYNWFISLGNKISDLGTFIVENLSAPTWIQSLVNVIQDNFIIDGFNQLWDWLLSVIDFFSIPVTYDSANLTFWDYLLGRTGEDGSFWDYQDDAGFIAGISRFFVTVRDIWSCLPVPVHYLLMFGFGLPVSFGVLKAFLR